MINLYDYQLSIVDGTRAAMRRNRANLVVVPTGGGKTVLSCYIIAAAAAKGSTATFLIPRKELMRQVSATMADFNIPHGLISPDYAPNPFANVQVAMAQTLIRRMGKMTPPKLLMVDEAHIGGADIERIIAWVLDAGGWVVGLTATPSRADGKALGGVYSEIIEGPSVADLIAAKRLSDYRYFGPGAPDLSKVAVGAHGDYVQSQLSSFMEADKAIIGDAVKTYKQFADGKLNIVFATSRKHSGMISEAFSNAGVASAYIDGTMNDAERRKIIMAFARRELKVLTSVALLSVGFDLSSAAGIDVTVESMSDLAPTKSLPLQAQRWGRVLRAKPYPAIIMDHANNWREHGFPDDPREWSLDGKKKRAASDEKAEPARQCPIDDGGCGFVHRPAPECPNCKRVYPIMSRMVDEVDGELAEIDRAAMVRERKQEQGRADTLEDLIRVGAARGMKNPAGWARHVFAARQSKR